MDTLWRYMCCERVDPAPRGVLTKEGAKNAPPRSSGAHLKRPHLLCQHAYLRLIQQNTHRAQAAKPHVHPRHLHQQQAGSGVGVYASQNRSACRVRLLAPVTWTVRHNVDEQNNQCSMTRTGFKCCWRLCACCTVGHKVRRSGAIPCAPPILRDCRLPRVLSSATPTHPYKPRQT